MSWCTYFQDGSDYWCEKTGKKPSYDMIYSKCKYDGYGCSHYYESYIATFVGYTLNKPMNSKVLSNIRNLQRNFLEKDESYAGFVEMYKAIGPSIIENMDQDKEKEDLSKKVYTVLNRVSIFIDKGKNDKAIDYYCKMVGILVNRYNLNTLYNTEADFFNKKYADAKKVPKLTKTIEK